MSAENTETAKRVRIRKPAVNPDPAPGVLGKSDPSAPDATASVGPVIHSDCPPADSARGEKTPARIRWNSIHRKDEMESIYRGWDWSSYLAANPE